jgi:hypothetical protein
MKPGTCWRAYLEYREPSFHESTDDSTLTHLGLQLYVIFAMNQTPTEVLMTILKLLTGTFYTDVLEGPVTLAETMLILRRDGYGWV